MIVGTLIQSRESVERKLGASPLTSLQWACVHGTVRAAIFLLENGANPNAVAVTVDGWTPLIVAAECA